MGFTSAGRAKIGSAAKLGRTKWAYGKYDFATLGGAIGDITLTGDVVPAGAHILAAVIMVDTIPVGATATIAVKVDDATLQAAAAISGAPWSTTGNKLAAGSTRAIAPLIPTAAGAPKITVATAALTAGIFRVIVEYVEVDT